MLPEVEALIALQGEDAEIYTLEDRLAALQPRLDDLARERERLVENLARTRQTADTESAHHREMQDRLSQHRQLQDRNQATLDHLTRPKEAAAAMSQLETSRRLMAEAETDAQGASHRLNELRGSIQHQEAVIAALESAQAVVRSEILAERQQIEGALREAQAKREGVAVKVPRPMLAKYDRVRGRKRAGAVYALRGGACGSCDTAIPLQRRNVMQRTGEIEMCEGCGVLLYAIG
ncbi:MAG: hypothetical protein NVS1B4_15370 [Gemmatimonadaceae bacterium]